MDTYDGHQDWKRQDELHEKYYADRGYEAELQAHPACTDPNHPGCEHCATPIGVPVRYN